MLDSSLELLTCRCYWSAIWIDSSGQDDCPSHSWFCFLLICSSGSNDLTNRLFRRDIILDRLSICQRNEKLVDHLSHKCSLQYQLTLAFDSVNHTSNLTSKGGVDDRYFNSRIEKHCCFLIVYFAHCHGLFEPFYWGMISLIYA